MLADLNIQNAVENSSLRQPQRNSQGLSGAKLTATIEEVLNRPLEYPPLSDAIYEGDCVVIALQSATQEASSILQSVVKAINGPRANPISITVLAERFTAEQLDLTGIPNVSLAIHDPDGDNLFACLAVGANDQPLHINRLLFDADIVIPIGCLNPQQNIKIDDCIYPWFSNQQNRERFRELSERERADDVQHVNDQLGTFFVIQLIVGPGDAVQSVLAGDRRAVLKAAKQKLSRAWNIETDQSADLVVATIESRATEHTWDDFARALINADRCSQLSAPIVICSDIRKAPPRETRAALVDPEPDSEKRTESIIRQIKRIVAEHPVFLASRLPQSDVEEIGLGYLAAIDQLRRMLEKSSQGLFLRDAHKCQVTVTGAV